MQNKSNSSGTADGRGGSSAQNVSLDVLCRRAERLIDSVRVAGEQVEHMFTRPQRTIDEANQTARSLLDLRKQLEDRLTEVKAAEQACGQRVEELKHAVPTIHKSAESLIQRVVRARELTETFGKMMDSSGDKIALIQAASDEAAKVRAAIDNAICELTRVQKAADNWTGSVSVLTGKHTELIAAGNAAASRLRTITDAGQRLGETVRQDVVALRELLRESRLERIAWEQLLARIPAAMNASATKQSESAAAVGDNATQSVPAALANRVKKLADLVRQATGTTEPITTAARQAAQRQSTTHQSQASEQIPVSAGIDAG